MTNDFLPQKLLSRVLLIKYGQATGSSFVFDNNNKNYLLSAKHVFENIVDKQPIDLEVSHAKSWITINGIVHLHPNTAIDIVLIELNKNLFNTNPVVLENSGNVVFGDFGYFLGFPLGIKGEDFSNVNCGYPLPLIKRAVYSGYTDKDGISVELLDGQNNPGFSGGPTFFRHWNNGQFRWELFSVISAYYNQQNQIVTPFGNWNYTENSGIIISYSVRHVIEILNLLNQNAT